MKLTRLTAISPIDGRYGDRLECLQSTFSEFGLMRFRILVEIRWLQLLIQQSNIVSIPHLPAEAEEYLENIFSHFNQKDAEAIKKIEKETNHDVKAVEYFIKERLNKNADLANLIEFVHFTCTSEDINNLAYGLMLKTTLNEYLIPKINHLITELTNLAHKVADVPMLSRTHGQPASSTTMGKEIANFVSRLNHQHNQIKNTTILGKFNGAVGNYNAHIFAFSNVDWEKISKIFVESLGLSWNLYTTQIEPHDMIAEVCHNLIRLNNILIDFCRDIWVYISLEYFIQIHKENEVGSSTMPHKINPIDFENAEGNLGLANSLFNHFANKLPISRLQRDLSDSTAMRNIGVAFSHALIAYQSILKGLSNLEINREKLLNDLNNHWEILAEPIQTVMRKYKINLPYEKLKSFTRGKKINKELLHDFIDSLDLPNKEKIKLKELSPDKYLGLAVKLAEEI